MNFFFQLTSDVNYELKKIRNIDKISDLINNFYERMKYFVRCNMKQFYRTQVR